MKVTAEGVERPAQLALLRNYSIHLQGYLLSRPLPESQVREALQTMPARLQGLLLDCGAGGASRPQPPEAGHIDAASPLAQAG